VGYHSTFLGFHHSEAQTKMLALISDKFSEVEKNPDPLQNKCGAAAMISYHRVKDEIVDPRRSNQKRNGGGKVKRYGIYLS